MSTKYRELVAIRVTVSKVSNKYKLVHFYRVVTPEVHSGALALEGYEMERHDPAKAIAESLRNAYAPATIKVWAQDEEASTSELLQFHSGCGPEDLSLHGDWSLWAEL